MLKMDVIIVNVTTKTMFALRGNSWGEGGSSKSPLERKFRRGGGMQTKNLPWEGYGYFLEPHIRQTSIQMSKFSWSS